MKKLVLGLSLLGLTSGAFATAACDTCQPQANARIFQLATDNDTTSGQQTGTGSDEATTDGPAKTDSSNPDQQNNTDD